MNTAFLGIIVALSVGTMVGLPTDPDLADFKRWFADERRELGTIRAAWRMLRRVA